VRNYKLVNTPTYADTAILPNSVAIPYVLFVFIYCISFGHPATVFQIQ